MTRISAVMARPTMTRMIARDTNGSSATSFSAMIMISADKMKSVVMALRTMASSGTGLTAAAGTASACFEWPEMTSQTFSAPS